MKKVNALLAAVTSFALVACADGPAAKPPTFGAPPQPGAVRVTMIGPTALDSSQFRQAIVTGNPIPGVGIRSVHAVIEARTDFRVAKKWLEPQFPKETAFDDVPAGEYTVSAYALDNEDGPYADHTVYASSSTVTVIPGAGSATHLFMQEVAPGENITAPFIHALTVAGTPPVISKPVHLRATVRGAPSQAYLWTVACPDAPTPEAPFTTPTSTATDLTLHHCSSDATVTFSVTNPNVPGANGSLTSTVQLVLNYFPQGANVGLAINSWPNITSISTASNTAPLPGEAVDLVAVASDPDGDRLTYAWSDDCGGSFTAANTLTPTWTAPSSAGALCELKLTVREAGNADGHNDGVNSGTFTLRVAPSL